MTEVFKCKKSGTKCCAPKSLIKEVLGQSDEQHKENTIDSISTQSTTPVYNIIDSSTPQSIFY